ncbi:hypothetical protein ACWDZ6_28430 [Streptomyces sp. NPDC002926]
MMRLRIATTALVLSGALLTGAPAASAAYTPTTAVAVQKTAAAPEAGSSVTRASTTVSTVAKDRKKNKKKKKKKSGLSGGLVIGLILGIAVLVIIVLLLMRRNRSDG